MTARVQVERRVPSRSAGLSVVADAAFITCVINALLYWAARSALGDFAFPLAPEPGRELDTLDVFALSTAVTLGGVVLYVVLETFTPRHAWTTWCGLALSAFCVSVVALHGAPVFLCGLLSLTPVLGLFTALRLARA